jgi:hypothetical protein
LNILLNILTITNSPTGDGEQRWKEEQRQQ